MRYIYIYLYVCSHETESDNFDFVNTQHKFLASHIVRFMTCSFKNLSSLLTPQHRRKPRYHGRKRNKNMYITAIRHSIPYSHHPTFHCPCPHEKRGKYILVLLCTHHLVSSLIEWVRLYGWLLLRHVLLLVLLHPGIHPHGLR